MQFTWKVGQRVQLHPRTDRWMMGDRYGEVSKEIRLEINNLAVLPEKKLVAVKMDRSGKTLKVHPGNLILID